MIAFIADYPFHIYLYKNILRILKSENLDVELVISDVLQQNMSEDKRIEKKNLMINLADKLDLPWRYFSGLTTEAKKFFSKYKILVSPWYYGAITYPCNQNKRKVCIAYGYGKDIHHFGIWRRHFDLILTRGHYSDDFLKLYTQTKIVGAPQYDDWFAGIYDITKTNELLKTLNPRKKTIIYLPTHDLLSSIEFILPELKLIMSDYNLIIKPHHITIWEDNISMERLYSLNKEGAVILNDEYCDLSLLFKIGDVVLGDNSGSIFETLLFEKPIVIIDFIPSNFLKTAGTYKIKKMNTCHNSLEQIIKRDENKIGPVIRNTNSLRSALNEAIVENENFFSNREKFKKKLFSFFDSQSSQRAAAAIKEMAFSQQYPEKTLLSKVIEIGLADNTSYLYKRVKNLEAQLKLYTLFENNKILKESINLLNKFFLF